MKDFFSKHFAWLRESNRPAHMKAGFLVFFIMMFIQGILFSFAEGSLDVQELFARRLILVAAIVALVATFLLMCTVEYVQKMGYKSVWDWLDVTAGIIPATVIVIILVLFFLLL